jgi:DNA-directed RNA polymerase subunit beta
MHPSTALVLSQLTIIRSSSCDELKTDIKTSTRDVLAATDHLIGMKFGTGILDDDDMNHLVLGILPKKKKL